MASDIRNLTIDGARGYLALVVMCHHFLICWIFFQTGSWEIPPVTSFANFGPISVSMFFMITAYLFYGKILVEANLSWNRLYINRIFRLAPMYLFSISIMIIVILVETSFSRNETYGKIFIQIFKWATFTVFGSPNFNGYENTGNIIAGVTWSLRYEWLFYAGLPLLSLVLSLIGRHRALRIACLASMAIVLVYRPNYLVAGFEFKRLLAFPLGMIAFEFARIDCIRKIASSTLADDVLLFLLVALVALPMQPYGSMQMFFVGCAFLLIASGSTLFGILTAGFSRTLGDASYSIYLLHGIVLFLLFRSLQVTEIDLSTPWIWVTLPAAIIVVSGISVLTYNRIEKPFIELGRRSRLAVGTLGTKEVAP